MSEEVCSAEISCFTDFDFDNAASVLRKMPPGKVPPGKMPPRKVPPGYKPPRKTAFCKASSCYGIS